MLCSVVCLDVKVCLFGTIVTQKKKKKIIVKKISGEKKKNYQVPLRGGGS